jgi:hypothetical protein
MFIISCPVTGIYWLDKTGAGELAEWCNCSEVLLIAGQYKFLRCKFFAGYY